MTTVKRDYKVALALWEASHEGGHKNDTQLIEALGAIIAYRKDAWPVAGVTREAFDLIVRHRTTSKVGIQAGHIVPRSVEYRALLRQATKPSFDDFLKIYNSVTVLMTKEQNPLTKAVFDGPYIKLPTCDDSGNPLFVRQGYVSAVTKHGLVYLDVLAEKLLGS